MVKSIVNVLCIISVVCFFSCNTSENKNITLNNKEGLLKVEEIIQNQFGSTKEVSSLVINRKNTNSTEIDQITIQFVEDGKSSLWFYSFVMGKLFKPEPTKNNVKNSKMLPLKSFNINEITTNFNKAVALVEKETKEFKDFQLNGDYNMYVDEKSGEIIHSFYLYAYKIDVNSTSFYGQRVKSGSNLFEFSFRTDEKGELKSTKGLNIFE